MVKRGRSTPLAEALRSSDRNCANGCTVPLMENGAEVYTRPATLTLAGLGWREDTAETEPSMRDSSAV
ncbi:Uncharacterised protein [Bordetella pertussis]|nr:Uncharacterised protein [Bordetella pertussis]CFO29333.1 Uncharacterised protein [Bordetella pertussis]CFW10006.1 Uncharacterised protein [Bordetella pertussis]CPK41829.1 Uncharacterised protein [Bordetella pertussis]CPO90301.1 Uncharacterised protein [Bordetella pertussis]